MSPRLLALALPALALACAPADKGDTGSPATDGTDGSDGTDSSDGSDGTDSSDGTDGSDGSDGSDGGDGADGEAVRFGLTLRNVSVPTPFSQAATFSVPDGETAAGPLAPGAAYTLRFPAAPGARLGFATMFVQSNDLFYAPDPAGLALFDADGQPLVGDRTAEVHLWDAGTEADEALFEGTAQAPRQSGPDMGAPDPDNRVRRASAAPAVDETIAVRLDHDGEAFTLTIENIADDHWAGPLLLAPGVAAVHGAEGMLFAADAPASPGLEMLAEDGDPSGILAEVEAETGLWSPLAPGAWVVHTGPSPLFTADSPASPGLEMLAEDGDPSGMLAELEAMGLSAGVFTTPDGATAPGPLLPGQSIGFTVEARPGASLSLATMLVFSNDLFLAPDADGIALFDGDTPRSATVSSRLVLWDAGTEANQAPGAGLDQAPWQTGPDTGAADPDDRVRPVDDGFAYPGVELLVELELAPLD